MTAHDKAAELEPLALDELHQRLGARFENEGGMAAPGDYGDPAAELAALRDRCGVVDLSWASRLELRGRDRNRFLNGLVTSNVKDLGAGLGRLRLPPQQAGARARRRVRHGARGSPVAGAASRSSDRLRQHIESYKVIDDVEIARLDDMALIGVLGPAAGALLGGAAEALALDRSTRVKVDGCEVQLTRRRVFGIDGFVFWIVSSLAEDVVGRSRRRRRCAADPARAVGLRALDARRTELGVGRYGVDFGEETVANETGLVAEAIDFTKGCYLGQEIVARIFYKGKPSQPVTALEVRDRTTPPRLRHRYTCSPRRRTRRGVRRPHQRHRRRRAGLVARDRERVAPRPRRGRAHGARRRGRGAGPASSRLERRT